MVNHRRFTAFFVLDAAAFHEAIAACPVQDYADLACVAAHVLDTDTVTGFLKVTTGVVPTVAPLGTRGQDVEV